jgi:RNA recognition motif-containing protein
MVKKRVVCPVRFARCCIEPVALVCLNSESVVTIYVGNLSFQASEEDLWEVFGEYGKVTRITLPTDRETGKKRGFAFVEMEKDSEEDAIIAELDGAEWMGRELKVNKARPRESREGGGGRDNRRPNGGFSGR